MRAGRGASSRPPAPKPSRDAHFVCALALCWPDGPVEMVRGPGRRHAGLAAARRPRLRLRSDVRAGRPRPHLRRDGPGREARISHRADAFRKLVAALLSVNARLTPSGRAVEVPVARACEGRAFDPLAANGTRATRPLRPLAVLRLQMPLLRLQQPCPRVDRPGGVARGAARRPRLGGRSLSRAAARLDLLRRRHAVADGAGDGRRADRGGRARIGAWRRTSRSRSRPTPRRSRRRASPTSPRPGSTASRSASSRSTTRRCASSAAPMMSPRAWPRSTTAQRCFERVSFDLIYALARPERGGLGGGARAGARLRHRPPLALPADDRARHALRRARRARASWRPRDPDRGGGPVRADPGDDRGGRAARLRDLQPRPARRGEPPQPHLLALPALSRDRPGRARPARRRRDPAPPQAGELARRARAQRPRHRRGDRARAATSGRPRRC